MIQLDLFFTQHYPPKEVMDALGKPCTVCAWECKLDSMCVLLTEGKLYPFCSPYCLQVYTGGAR